MFRNRFAVRLWWWWIGVGGWRWWCCGAEGLRWCCVETHRFILDAKSQDGKTHLLSKNNIKITFDVRHVSFYVLLECVHVSFVQPRMSGLEWSRWLQFNDI